MKTSLQLAVFCGLGLLLSNYGVGQDVAGPQSLPAQSLQVDSSSTAVESVPRPNLSVFEQTRCYQSGWGILRDDGSLHGIVHAFPGGSRAAQASASVRIEQGASVVASATTDGDGQFVIEGLQPGVHTLRVDAGGAYAVYSVMLARSSDDSSSVMQVYCAAMPRSEVDRVLAELWAPGNWFDEPLSSAAPMLRAPAPGVQSPQVRMLNGQVNGQLVFPHAHWLASGHVVRVFRGGRQIASASADEFGRFAFEPGSAGPVDIVAGGGAYGSMSIEIIDGDASISSVEGNDAHYVARLQQASDVAIVPLVGDSSTPYTGEEVVLADNLAPCGDACCAPMGGYMGGGGGFTGGGGGGGGFGGMGGLGGLLGAAGLAIGIAALADDDDDGFNFNIPTPLGP